MRLRSLFDVRMLPDGKRVAHVVSTPSIERAKHEAVADPYDQGLQPAGAVVVSALVTG